MPSCKTSRNGFRLDEHEAFTKTIVTGDDLFAVLRGQMFIERALERLLLAKIPHSALLIERLGFHAKLDACRALDLVPKDWVKGIQTINSLRNAFAHNETRDKLTAEDSLRVKNALHGLPKSYFDGMLDAFKKLGGSPFASNPGRDARVGIMVMFML